MDVVIGGTYANRYSIYENDVTITGYSGDIVVGVTDAQPRIYLNGQHTVTVSVLNKREAGDFTETPTAQYDSQHDLTYFDLSSIRMPLTSTGGYEYITASDYTSLAAAVRAYFDTHPASGSGTATVEIDIEGERLTFESQSLGNTITRFIDDDAEVDMEE